MNDNKYIYAEFVNVLFLNQRNIEIVSSLEQVTVTCAIFDVILIRTQDEREEQGRRKKYIIM